MKDKQPVDQPQTGSEERLDEAMRRLDRRRLVRAALTSAPIVLTFTAGSVYGQEGESVKDSSKNSVKEMDELDELELGGDEEDELDALTPAEELETFGLERVDRPDYYDEDPFRNLDLQPKIDDSIDPGFNP